MRKLAYETYIGPKLEYAAAIWSPHQIYLLNHLEAVQNRAARFILKKHDWSVSVSALKSELNLPLLNVRRKIARLCLFHKIYCCLPALQDSLLLPPRRSSSRLNHPSHAFRISGSTTYFNSSFFPRTIVDWNDLPSLIVTQTDPAAFCHALFSHFC